MFVGTNHEQPRMQTAAGLTRPTCNSLIRVIGHRHRIRQVESVWGLSGSS